MRKITVHNINSDSENVKKIFRKVINDRTIGFLSSITLSNDEILEVYKLSCEESGEKITNKNHATMIMSNFLRVLIESQKGPFNEEVINTFIEIIVNIATGSNLFVPVIMKADKSISENTKYKWVIDTQKRMGGLILYQFVNKSKAAGVDFTKEPWKKASILNEFINVSYSIFVKQIEEFYVYFDEMTEDELFDFYMEIQEMHYVSIGDSRKIDIDKDKNFKFWFNYPRTTVKIITHYLEDYLETKSNTAQAIKMADHPNCPVDLKMKMFNETNNPLFLPEDVKATFVF